MDLFLSYNYPTYFFALIYYEIDCEILWSRKKSFKKGRRGSSCKEFALGSRSVGSTQAVHHLVPLPCPINLSQLWTFKLRCTTFLNNINLADLLLLRL